MSELILVFLKFFALMALLIFLIIFPPSLMVSMPVCFMLFMIERDEANKQ